MLAAGYPFLANQIMNFFLGGQGVQPGAGDRIVVALFAFLVSSGLLVLLCHKAIRGDCFRFGCLAAVVAFVFYYGLHPHQSFAEVFQLAVSDPVSLTIMLIVVTAPISAGVLGRVSLQKTAVVP
ncbi:MAG: hypothetical protein AAF492_24460 [Verrucomicrobiota bacterium]